MNLNEYIKQTEEEFQEKFGDNGAYWQEIITEIHYGDPDFKSLLAFIKTRIERGVELARQEAIDVVEGLKRTELLHDEPDEIKRTIMITERTINIGYNQALDQVIKKLEEMKE